MSNVDQFVDDVYNELEKLYKRDQNLQKDFLGDQPIARIFDYYSDWLVNNLALSPRVAANAIYKDVQNINYRDFGNRSLKKGVQIKGQAGFNLIYGSQVEIDRAVKLLTQIRNQSEDRYELIVNALEKVKMISDKVKPEKNIFTGKLNTTSIEQNKMLKMPRIGTVETFLKMSDNQLKNYINTLNKSLGI